MIPERFYSNQRVASRQTYHRSRVPLVLAPGRIAEMLYGICEAYTGILQRLPEWWTGGPFQTHELAYKFIRELAWAIWVEDLMTVTVLVELMNEESSPPSGDHVFLTCTNPPSPRTGGGRVQDLRGERAGPRDLRSPTRLGDAARLDQAGRAFQDPGCHSSRSYSGTRGAVGGALRYKHQLSCGLGTEGIRKILRSLPAPTHRGSRHALCA